MENCLILKVHMLLCGFVSLHYRLHAWVKSQEDRSKSPKREETWVWAAEVSWLIATVTVIRRSVSETRVAVKLDVTDVHDLLRLTLHPGTELGR